MSYRLPEKPSWAYPRLLDGLVWRSRQTREGSNVRGRKLCNPVRVQVLEQCWDLDVKYMTNSLRNDFGTQARFFFELRC